jgi:hypothetical protein
MDSYDVHVHPVQFQLYNKESFWTFNIIKNKKSRTITITNKTNEKNVHAYVFVDVDMFYMSAHHCLYQICKARNSKLRRIWYMVVGSSLYIADDAYIRNGSGTMCADLQYLNQYTCTAKNRVMTFPQQESCTTPSISLLHLRGSKQILSMFAD